MRSRRSKPWTGGHRSWRSGPGSRKQTHDYLRHGTTTLFAALEVATGKVTRRACRGTATRSSCASSNRSPRPTRGGGCAWWWTNYATHNHPAVRAWLARNPRIALHFTPTSGSWLNLVEIFFSIITGRPSGAAASPASRTSSPPSDASSTAGTSAANPSPGPRPRTTYSATAAPVKEPRLRDTSESMGPSALRHDRRLD